MVNEEQTTEVSFDTDLDKRNPFTIVDFSLIGIFVISALIYIINDPLSTIGDIQVLNFTVFCA